MSKKKVKKKRAKEYEPKLKVNASWIDVINSAVAPEPEKKKATPKKK